MMINEKESSWDLILMHQGQRQSVLQWAAQGEASCLCVEILNCGFMSGTRQLSYKYDLGGKNWQQTAKKKWGVTIKEHQHKKNT